MTVDSVQEHSETASEVSGQTLVEKTEDDPSFVVIEHGAGNDGSTAMEVDEADVSTTGSTKDVDLKNSRLSVEELSAEINKEAVGSDQMDVDEVMGNAIDHLRASIKISRAEDSNSGPDPIEQAFFSTFIDNRKKSGDKDWTRTARTDRWVTAIPSQPGMDLYDALAASFDLEQLAGDLSSFTSIDKPAPHFHICIQRSQAVGKNENPIIIYDRIYLDRFMHDSDVKSQRFKARKRAWDIKTRLNEMTATASKSPVESSSKGDSKNTAEASTTGAEASVDGFLLVDKSALLRPDAVGSNRSMTSPGIAEVSGRHTELDTQLPKPVTTISPPPEDVAIGDQLLPPTAEDNFWREFDEQENNERDSLLMEKQSLFKSMETVPYRLHAVICHTGSANAGHYWVWIHDFEKDVWRKYNDRRVTEHSPEEVFAQLNSKGEPYYLAYVRESEINNLVSIPKRQLRDVEMQDAPPAYEDLDASERL